MGGHLSIYRLGIPPSLSIIINTVLQLRFTLSSQLNVSVTFILCALLCVPSSCTYEYRLVMLVYAVQCPTMKHEIPHMLVFSITNLIVLTQQTQHTVQSLYEAFSVTLKYVPNLHTISTEILRPLNHAVLLKHGILAQAIRYNNIYVEALRPLVLKIVFPIPITWSCSALFAASSYMLQQ